MCVYIESGTFYMNVEQVCLCLKLAGKVVTQPVDEKREGRKQAPKSLKRHKVCQEGTRKRPHYVPEKSRC